MGAVQICRQLELAERELIQQVESALERSVSWLSDESSH
jgi:hypothetical protein